MIGPASRMTGRSVNARAAHSGRNRSIGGEMLFYGRVRELIALLSGANEDIDLDRAALALARIEHPGLDPQPFLGLLDSYAVEVAGRVTGEDGAAYVAAANRFLFDELGFYGNTADYYDPRNSCLNDVLMLRTGIPITLSLVYLEIARRLAKPVHGIGMPGHFLVQYDDGRFSVYIDPFHGGQLLTAGDCFRVAREMAGAELTPQPDFLRPVSKRQILLRMLNNLRSIYFTRRTHAKALEVMDLILSAAPSSPDEYRQRAAVQIHLGRFSAARQDLERYLSLAPASPDRKEVEEQIRKIRRYVAGLN
jgi:regulator of sirC expression with transglutaminase-like and TPR domain